MKINLAIDCLEGYEFNAITSIHSFLNTNKWFDGKIYIIVPKHSVITSRISSEILSIYENFEIVNAQEDLNFSNELSKASSDLTKIQTILSIKSLYIKEERVLFISSGCLIFKDLSKLLGTNEVTLISNPSAEIDFSVFYRNKIANSSLSISQLLNQVFTDRNSILSLFQTNQKITTVLGETSSSFNDRVFLKKKSVLNLLNFIKYDTLRGESRNYSKINYIWIQHQKVVKNILKRPASFKGKRTLNKSLSPKLDGLLNSPQAQPTQNKNIQSATKEVNLNKARSLLRVRETDKRYLLNEKKKAESLSQYHETVSQYSETPPRHDYATACVIAFLDRHEMVELNVKLLSQQSLVPAIVLVASNPTDAAFANGLIERYPNVFVTYYQNYPIGGKWRAGVKYAQRLNVRGLMILGSDDLLSLDYFKKCYSMIDRGNGSSGTGVDLVGNRSWFIYDTSRKLYNLSYLPSVKIFLGGGKMFSKNFLDAVDWEIFKPLRPVHLDEYGYELIEAFSNSMSLISQDNFILSIKGSWEVINSTDAILKARNRIRVIDVTTRLSTILNNLKIDRKEIEI
jgi:hypothetical protein